MGYDCYHYLYADAFEKGICPQARLSTNEILRINPFDDFICLSTTQILVKFVYLSETPTGTDGRPAYPIPCIPLRMGYVSRPELLRTPDMNKKEQEDMTYLSISLINDCGLLTKGKFASKLYESGKLRAQAPMEDEFSKHLELLLSRGIISMSLVFASQIFLGIQDILRDAVGNGYRDLKDTTAALDKIINLKVREGSFELGGSGESWHEKNINTVMHIKFTSLGWITDLPFMKFKDFSLGVALPPNNAFFSPGLSEQAMTAANRAVGSSQTQSVGSIGQLNTQKKPKPPKDPKFDTTSVAVPKIPKNFNRSMRTLRNC